MQQKNNMIFRIATAFALFMAMSAAWTQPQVMPPYSVTVTPEQAFISPGDGLQLEAHLFDVQGNAMNADGIDWIVKPDSLGKISDDGFFQAGKTQGEVTVLAVLKRGFFRFYGEAKIAIGQPRPPFIKIDVFPENAVVEPGGEQQYRIVAVTRDNSNFKIDHIRWKVEPGRLGKIGQQGVFHAGQNPGQGRVIAFVDINSVVYRGSARVTVSERPTASISGVVTDKDSSEPLEGAHVLVQKVGHIRWARSVHTDSVGNYTAHKLIPGLYIVRANAKDYLPEYYDNKEQLSEANVITVAAEDSLTGIDFALGHGGTINGFVKTESDSTPIARGLVSAIHIISKRKKHAISHEDGTFEIRALKAGDYHVVASTAGYKS
ncbi:MAG: collagen binding domain-containing protein, partial [bacterium]